MLYATLKFIATIALKIFFKRIRVKNAQRVPRDIPLIIVSNHPSTLMDALIIGTNIRKPIYFIAKGSLFNNRLIHFLLNCFHMIPIYRRQDDPALMERNEEIFQRCYHFLEKKKALLIFPEGVSKGERRLHRIKTGAARIALGAERSNNYRLGVVVVPVGLYYTKLGIFRSDLFINFGSPIAVSDFFELHRENDRKAVSELTNHIRESLEENTISIETEELAGLVEHIEIIYKRRLFEDLGSPPEEKPDDFQLAKGISDAVHYFHRHDPLLVKTLMMKIAHYTGNLKRLHFKDDALNTHGSLPNSSFKTVGFILFGFPVYLYGIVSNYPPYKLTARLSGKMTDAIEYQGTVKLLLGTCLFSLYYALLIWAVSSKFDLWYILFICAVTFPVSGFFALSYWDRLEKIKGFLNFISIFYRRKHLVAKLLQQRMDIVNMIEKAQQDYLGRNDTTPF
jgi:1-acyl-sn-glycerol-3-phosphate acyltransferase